MTKTYLTQRKLMRRIAGLINSVEDVTAADCYLADQDAGRVEKTLMKSVQEAVEELHEAFESGSRLQYVEDCKERVRNGKPLGEIIREAVQVEPGDEQPEKVNVELNVGGKTITVKALMTDSALEALRSFKNEVNKSDIQLGDVLEYGHNQWSVISVSKTRDICGNLDGRVQLQVQLLTGPIHAVECIWLHELDTQNLIIHSKDK